MTDLELLDLAAKAAEIELDFATSCGEGFRAKQDGRWTSCWSPLVNDGDALRLAVKLHIDMRQFMYRDNRMDCLVDRVGKGFVEHYTDDPYAATRRAIVRAAAEIGKSMSPN